MDISNQIDEVQAKHKGLIFHLKDAALSGELVLPEGDSYELRIVLSQYPRFFPTVYETGGRIPVKMDRHMYIDTGSCCFTTSAKSQILLKTKITSLLKFVDEIVVRYLENNSFYEINGEYCYEEYDHGSLGVIQSYQDILAIKKVKSIAKLMLQRLDNKKLRIRDLCYCDSGQSLKKCTNGIHCINYKNFRLIEKDVLFSDLKHLKIFMNLK